MDLFDNTVKTYAKILTNRPIIFYNNNMDVSASLKDIDLNYLLRFRKSSPVGSSKTSSSKSEIMVKR
jgi:hypothetical protein